jgi:hypothetical protein
MYQGPWAEQHDLYNEADPYPKSRSERIPRYSQPTLHRLADQREESTFTKIATANSMKIIAIFFLSVIIFYTYISQSKQSNPSSKTVNLTREDCLELFKKHNCTTIKPSSKICEDLNFCLRDPSNQQCILVKQG